MTYNEAAAKVSKLSAEHRVPMHLEDFGDEFLVVDPFHDEEPPMASGATPGEALKNLEAWLVK